MAIQERQLKVLGINNLVTAARVVKSGLATDKEMFELHVCTSQNAEWDVLLTAHDEVRLFPNLNFVFKYISDCCPHLEEIKLLLTPIEISTSS